MKPIVRDDLEPTQREAKFHRMLDIMSKQFGANEEQIKAIRRAYDAPVGLNLVHGGPKTGKTATALL